MVDAYAHSGVRTTADAPEFASLTNQIRATFAFRQGTGRPLLDLGYYANVLDFGAIGIAVSMDGVGTKVIVAQQAGDYRSIGIDLIAMNVNDLLCVGADPVALLDYIAVEQLDSPALAGLAASLVEGARLSGISIPGGEVAQVKELITSHGPGTGFDIVGTALGVVDPRRIMVGADIVIGDILVGIASSGLHSNGYTLARQLLLTDGWSLDTVPAELGRSLAEELLEPTRIYVPLFRELWRSSTEIHGAFHITGEGLLNLMRTPQPLALELENWPNIPSVFEFIKSRGALDQATLFTTFNMGIGMVLAVPPHAVTAVEKASAAQGWQSHVIGSVVGDTTRSIVAPPCGVRTDAKRLVNLV